jgi:hypothetical protein
MALTACSSSGLLSVVGLGSANDLQAISIEATPDCNRNMPVAMDLVFLADDNLAKLLRELNGPQWFEQKQALRKRYSDKLSLVNLEVVPLTVMDSVPLPDKHKDAKHILLFANYLGADGQLVAELSHYKDLKIILRRDAYQLQNLASGNTDTR